MISVCMATYNGGKYIREQIDSILPQLSSTDELIISDDGSTDDTVEIIKSYSEPRIKLLHFNRDKTGLEPVQMATTNFENALKHARGEIIFLCDQDDVWLPNKVAVCKSYMDNGIDLISHNYTVVTENLDFLRHSQYHKSFSFNRWRSLFGLCPFHGCSMVFNRSVLNRALPFPPKLQSHDRWIGWIACFGFKYLIPVNENLMLYRRHDGNISNPFKHKTYVYRIKTRLRYMFYLFKRLVLNH